MCIIAIKPKNIKMPKKKVLQECWNNNPDGAGYMYPSNGMVMIKKGFMKFDEFYKSLMYDYIRYGQKTPFIMHFRISTQGGVNKECCHPFPLSSKMEDLKYTRCKAKMGIAHNGIIDLTTTYYSARATVTYSDTMKFITDYLSLIIKDKTSLENSDTRLLIERLIDSKMAIMDEDGNITLIGEQEFIEDNGMVYSNDSYKKERPKRNIVYEWEDYYIDDDDEDDALIEYWKAQGKRWDSTKGDFVNIEEDKKED